jgi:hypothetical protein
MAKMDPSAADMASAVWNGYVRDARRHAGEWRPVEQVLQGSKDVGLGAAEVTSAGQWWLIWVSTAVHVVVGIG